MSRLLTFLGNFIVLATGFGLLARYVSPHTFWPPAVVALLLPLLLLFTLLFALLQLLRGRWRTAVFPALVLLGAVPILGRLFAWPEPAPTLPPDSPTLTLLTGNQRFFRSADGTDADTSRVGRTFRKYNVDVALLQEVRTTRYRVDYISQIQSADHLRQRHQKEGTLIATYGTAPEPVSANFSEPNEYNGFIVTDLPTPIGKLRIINAHLETNKISNLAEDIGGGSRSFGDRLETFGRMLAGYSRATRVRAQQADAIRTAVNESPYPVILGGDFNDVPSSYTYNQILSPRLRDAWSDRGSGLGATFTGPLPGLRIDYFLVDTSLTIVDIDRLAPQWSDHRPLRLTVAR
ncbi:endonuclease/exonuclease/phosphatase family protein [Neolewinella sp.]|uniref:endonuclease/exonuclease/phosphatase family protein n=1 Tax=Neolewinella sp. TaxID=2993543 RepID=UPI003B517F1C